MPSAIAEAKRYLNDVEELHASKKPNGFGDADAPD